MTETGSNDPGSTSPPNASPDAINSPGSSDRPSANWQAGAHDLAEQAKRSAESLLGQQKDAFAQRASTLADGLRQTATQLHGQNQPTVAKYANEAARGLDYVTNMLRTNDVNSIIAQGSRLAQRQPGMVMVGSIAAGFLLARFLKSTSASAQSDEPYSAQFGGGSLGGNAMRPESDYSAVDTPPIGG